jgi:hypothetical protein
VKQTVIAVFESPGMANEALHVLLRARFDAERLPRIERERRAKPSSVFVRLADSVRRRFEDFMDADMHLSPYASALAKGRFVVKVYASDDEVARGAARILVEAGGKEVDYLADEWVP